jgi:hypothetical protein
MEIWSLESDLIPLADLGKGELEDGFMIVQIFWG